MSSATSPVAELLSDLKIAFARLGLRWYLFGAQAAIVFGAARLTADVDVTVDLGARSIDELVEALRQAGFQVRLPNAEAQGSQTQVVPFVHERSRLPVDIVLAGPGLEELFFSRVEPVTVGGVSIPVVSAEDLVAMKLLAARSKDLDDAAAVVRARGASLDIDRIRVTLRRLEEGLDRKDLVDELEALLARARRRGQSD